MRWLLVCLAAPFKVVSLKGDMAEVELNGITQRISTALTPEAKIGDWVLVHAGFAIHTVDEEDAQETLSILEALYG